MKKSYQPAIDPEIVAGFPLLGRSNCTLMWINAQNSKYYQCLNVVAKKSRKNVAILLKV